MLGTVCSEPSVGNRLCHRARSNLACTLYVYGKGGGKGFVSSPLPALVSCSPVPSTILGKARASRGISDARVMCLSATVLFVVVLICLVPRRNQSSPGLYPRAQAECGVRLSAIHGTAVLVPYYCCFVLVLRPVQRYVRCLILGPEMFFFSLCCLWNISCLLRG